MSAHLPPPGQHLHAMQVPDHRTVNAQWSRRQGRPGGRALLLGRGAVEPGLLQLFGPLRHRVPGDQRSFKFSCSSVSFLSPEPACPGRQEQVTGRPLLGDFLPSGAGQCLRSPLLSPLATSSFQSISEPFPGSHFTSYFYLLNAGTHLSAHQTPNHPSKPMGTKALSTQYSLSENTPCKDCPECPFISVGLLGGPPI